MSTERRKRLLLTIVVLLTVYWYMYKYFISFPFSDLDSCKYDKIWGGGGYQLVKNMFKTIFKKKRSRIEKLKSTLHYNSAQTFDLRCRHIIFNVNRRRSTRPLSVKLSSLRVCSLHACGWRNGYVYVHTSITPCLNKELKRKRFV